LIYISSENHYQYTALNVCCVE